MADEPICIACRLRQAIHEHYPNGMTVNDAVEAMGALAQLAGEALADGNEKQIQSFVTLMLLERRDAQRATAAAARRSAH